MKKKAATQKKIKKSVSAKVVAGFEPGKVGFLVAIVATVSIVIFAIIGATAR